MVPLVVVGDTGTSFVDSNHESSEAPPTARAVHLGVVSSWVGMSLSGTTVVLPDVGGGTCTSPQGDLYVVPRGGTTVSSGQADRYDSTRLL